MDIQTGRFTNPCHTAFLAVLGVRLAGSKGHRGDTVEICAQAFLGIISKVMCGSVQSDTGVTRRALE